MSIKAVFGAAFRSLRREPVRSGLTCLGIIVGVAAVVVTAGIGAGARVRIQEAFERPETRTILLSAVSPPKKGRVARSTVPPGQGLQVEDYVAIRAIEGISASSPRIYRFATQAHATGRASDVLLEGLDVEGFGIFSHRLLRGALFNPFDVKNANNVTVISESLARLLYPGREALGQPLLIDGSAFSVLGIVDDLPDSASSLFGATDLHAYVPFTSLLRRIDGKAQMFIAVQANTVEEVEQVQLRISDVMEERRHGRKSMFVTRNSFDSIKSYADGSLTVARLLAAVGAVALIVGGIGIMNIMLVSVTERTREIGIRLALGTRQGDVLRQFLVEALVLSAMGGLAGLMAGVVGIELVGRLNDWPTHLTWRAAISAFLCSAAVGVFFGYRPARRASQLEPVQALRVE